MVIKHRMNIQVHGSGVKVKRATVGPGEYLLQGVVVVKLHDVQVVFLFTAGARPRHAGPNRQQPLVYTRRI
jgi:hypothetical protein